ncbi:MAG TPA: type II toxin-antitoxin system death-on-curing family toxin [Pseudolabrys sp.]|nr:type II toxin-antitoxin system death-on-curing family toxin [Pseudolabrys sp.]
MTEPRWLDLNIVLDFHTEQLALFGGPDGIRDLGLLESALTRPQNKFAYGVVDFAALAAAYGFGIARNHPFIDGNKRTALASLIVFLNLNKLDLDAPQEAATAIVVALAAGEIGEDVLARWIADHIKALDAPGIQP